MRTMPDLMPDITSDPDTAGDVALAMRRVWVAGPWERGSPMMSETVRMSRSKLNPMDNGLAAMVTLRLQTDAGEPICGVIEWAVFGATQKRGEVTVSAAAFYTTMNTQHPNPGDEAELQAGLDEAMRRADDQMRPNWQLMTRMPVPARW